MTHFTGKSSTSFERALKSGLEKHYDSIFALYFAWFLPLNGT
jgi:hypothetical protein